MARETADTTSITIYPKHRQIIEEVARRSGRSFSNAVQWIIGQWANEHPDDWNGQPLDTPTANGKTS